MSKRIQQLLLLAIVPGYIVMGVCLLYWFLLGTNVLQVHSVSINILVGLVFLLSAVSSLSGTFVKHYYIRSVQENLDNLDALNTKLRRQRHEYLNEMQVVYGLLELGEGEEALAFLRPIYEETAKTSRALKTAHPAVNALLMNKMNKAEEKHIAFYTEISSNLSTASMDAWSLCKVLGNLIDNALTAAAQDPKGEVHLEIREDARECEICIYNNGAFIAEKDKEKVFEDGFTGKTSEGHGFGLGIVRNLVRQAGGEIEMDSLQGKTTFTVHIPKTA
ncbi:MAG: Spo0B domain-containing protein [Firmicutes bacterium]|nr:Spo0B domain-containing protein [Bacillota bacterium]MBR3404530.1 Spo0B domain-containing protein [Bacillota bacterium]